MGLEHLGDPEPLRELEEVVVLVGGVDQDGLARLSAPHDVDVVLKWADHRLVDLGRCILIDQLARQHPLRIPQRGRTCRTASAGPTGPARSRTDAGSRRTVLALTDVTERVSR